MIPRQLKVRGIDVPVSQLALGTAFFRMDDYQANVRILESFLEMGGNLVDSGRIYSQSEDVLGRWFSETGRRDDVILITKCGHGPDGLLPDENLENIVSAELQTSLKTLKTDRIDIYMYHRDNPAVPVSRSLERLTREVENGAIRAAGASNWTIDRVQEANNWAETSGRPVFSLVSNNLSLAVPAEPFYPGLVWTDDKALEWHRQTGIPLLSWSSQARGFFTGRFTRGSASEADGFAKRMLEVYGSDDNFLRMKRAEEMGRQKGGYSAMQISLAWLAACPAPVIPVIGPHSVAELKSCAQALEIPLTDQERDWLNLRA